MRVMPPAPSTTLLEDALDIPLWLDADAERSLAERTHRDRAIGAGVANAKPLERVRAWWRRVDRGADELPGRRLADARRWLSIGVAVIGFVSGIGVALAAYRYDGSNPVNVVRVLALLVAPQLLLLALTVALLPGRLPALGRLQDALAAINVGSLVAAIYGRLGARTSSPVFGWSTARSASGRRFAKWQMLVWSQIAAVGFNLGAIATASALVAFTDLAFGWSTTLALDAESATRIFTAIAAPWESLVPAAVPDATLVEQSQYFRLQGRRAYDADASRALSGWWSFTLLAIVVYGLGSRLLFAALAAWRLRAATRALLLEDSRVTALLDRLSTPDVDTHGTETEPERAMPAPHATARTERPPTGPGNGVIWSDSIDAAAARELARARFGLALETIVTAGGGRLRTADRAALATLERARSVLVFAPAWEPPLLEFTDFLGELRTAVGPTSSIVVVPVADTASAEVGALERDIWAHAVRATADPRTYVETGDA